MALDKRNIALPFSTGIDTFTDPLQVMPMNLVDLQNAVFTQDKKLIKRNGFKSLSILPINTFPTTLTTFKGNLLAIGNSFQAFDANNETWFNKGRYQPVQLSVQSLVRSSSSQSSPDSALAEGLTCTTWADSDGNQKYQVVDSTSDQFIINATNLPAGAKHSRAFVVGNYFVVTFLITIIATPHLQYIAIPINNPSNPSAATDISNQVKSNTTGYDAYVANGYFYIAWNGSDVGSAIRYSFYNSNLILQGAGNTPLFNGDYITVVADASNVWISFYDIATVHATSLYTMALTTLLSPVLAPTLLDNANVLNVITSTSVPGLVTVYMDVANTYTYTSDTTDFLQYRSCTISGTPGTLTQIARSVGLASKAFKYNNVDYFLTVYDGVYQPTYFLMDSTGFVAARLAYSNAGSYVISGLLPSVNINGTVVSTSYSFKSTLTPVNKTQGAIGAVAGIFAQLGVNLVSFDLKGQNLSTAEIGNNLHIAGGYLWMYDGALGVEHNYHLFPEEVALTPSTTGGSVADGTYFYQVTYEWTDAQGNIHRSAPSVPVSTVVSGGGGSGSITLHVATLRLTLKPGVRIVIYRWSTAQQNYYQITSITTPLLNDKTVDNVTFVDIQSDAQIIGNQLIYTTGGIVENIAMPACSALGLFKSRLVVVDSEDPDLLWYSKQVIENTPVEPSDLFTIFVAPTLSSQGSTGSTKALSALDDKLICFKTDAIYYITGNGPDNLGQNNDFSDPTFITSTVGTDNHQGIVFTPQGLLFPSDKGIWLLGRDMSTGYLGAPAQAFNNNVVTSAVGIVGTNQVRFTLDNDKVLMYDYFFKRWGTFTNIAAISSCLYNNMHTFLRSDGGVRQETLGYYQDGSQPVLMAFTTAWMNLMGLQGFERAYMLYVLGTYLSPHLLNVQIAFDYNSSPSQSVIINPTNFAGTWGVVPPYWGQGVWGGPPNLEQWRIFLRQQKMQAFQVTIQEFFDTSFNTVPGAGLSFSGLNLVVGGKRGFVPLPASQSIG